MKYILVHEKNGDVFTDEFDNLKNAINTGDVNFDVLSGYDKKHCTAFYLLESVNPDESSIDHLDGDFVKIWKHDGVTFDYTVDIECYNAGYSHTETIESGTCNAIFSARDFYDSLADTEYFEKYRCITVIARFWLSGSDKIFSDPVNTNSYDVWF